MDLEVQNKVLLQFLATAIVGSSTIRILSAFGE